MPTFGTWEETVLDRCWDVADHISLHAYYDPAAYASVDEYLACSLDLERMIERVASIAAAVAARKGGGRQIGLSVDEWNVWRFAEHEAREAHARPDVFRRAPALAEDEQDLADALAVGCLLITLLRHADRVRIACLAQLVNVIAPIRTMDGGPAWRQTSFHVFSDAARFGRGTALRLVLDGPSHDVPGTGAVTAIDGVAVHDDSARSLAILAVNRVDRPLELDASVLGFDGPTLVEHRVLAHPEIHASNTARDPGRVVPARMRGAVMNAGRLTTLLPARSWNVIRLSPGSGRGPLP